MQNLVLSSSHHSGYQPSWSKDDRHIFLKESQAIGSISLAVLTQQLADFNEGWYPEWWDDDKTKFCIVNDFRS
jgi:hypothetical protein